MLWICGACALVTLVFGLLVFRKQQDKFGAAYLKGAQNMSMIEVNNVSMRFNMAKRKARKPERILSGRRAGKLQFEEFYALRDVSLTVERGDFYMALWGLNGSR